MKKNISIKKILSALVLGTALWSCSDFLELEPRQSLSTTESLSTIEGLETAIFGAYDGLQALNYYGRDFVVIPEAGGDNVYVSTDNSNRFLINYRYELTAANTQVGLWNGGYATILRVNNIINNIDNVTTTNTALKNQLLGEAYAIRALVHFDLARVFSLPYINGNGSQAGIPIKLDDVINEPARNTLAEVYTQVISDLNEAKGLLTNAEGPYRFTANAAEALLARVYLYQGNNAAAEASATAVIGAGYTLTPGAEIESFWSTSGNDEEIFTLRFLANETRGSDNLGQIYNPGGYGDIRVTDDIMDMYEAGDVRQDLYYLQSGEFYVGKFLGEAATPGLASPKVLRLSEMYLIRAEARAKQSNFSGAIDDVNEIRAVRGLADLVGVPNGNVLTEVFDEKRREFAFEGHRTFDLWRNNLPLQRTQCNSGLEIEAPCSIDANSFLRVYPIPQREIDVNQNMVQNPGYEN
jgi:hypothetical protein